MQQRKFTTIAFGLVLCGLMLVTHAGATQPTYSAGRRLALVFGNNQYAQLTDLVKAVNDAAAMAQELTAAGFQVINSHKYSDLDRAAMLDARDELMNALAAGDQVVVFYAGHGVQIGSEIYLMPVSFPLLKQVSAERVAEESITLQSIMDAVKNRIGADGFALYIVDACRSNPLPKTAGRSISEMLSRGLMPIQPPAGQIAIYAASNGQVALDSIKNDDPDPNGVFTRVLLKHIKKSGEPIMDVLADVQEEVIQLAAQVMNPDGSAHEQQPAIYNEARLKRPFCFYPNEYGCVKMPVESTVAVPKLVQLTIKSSIKSGQDQVLIDGENRGSTKLVVDLEPGIHNIQVMAAGFKVWEKELELTADTPYAVYAKLEPDAPIPPPPPSPLPRQDFEPEMVDIPAGSFKMGSPSNERGREADEWPVHTLHVKAFQMGKYEVTQGEWQAVMGNNPSHFSSCGERCPVEQVSWDDVQDYIAKLNAKTGKNYRLPSESEWEYAARAGTNTKYWWGSEIGNDNANCDGCGSQWDNKQPAPVGSFVANPWGLHDTVGNVWEWTCSDYTDIYDGTETTCKNRASADRVLRGGSWGSNPRYLRSASRNWVTADNRSNNNGFRLVRVLK